MAEIDTVYRALQVIALTLPAIALYMNVLTEIHMAVSRETGMQVDPDSPHLTGTGGEIEWEPDPYTARLTLASKQLDFALALMSFIFLLISGVVFLGYLVIPLPILIFVGISGVGIGYLILVSSLLTTFKITVGNIRTSD